MVKANLFITSGATALLVGALPAYAGDTYAGVTIGVAMPDSFDLDPVLNLDPDTSLLYGGFGGTSIASILRAEVEITHTSPTADCTGKCASAEFDVAALTLLGNAWLDIPIGTTLSPYIGGGAGFGRTSVDDGVSGKESGWGFAYQWGGGVRWSPPTSNVALDLGYRYKSTNMDAADSPYVFADTDFTAHVFQASLSVGF